MRRLLGLSVVLGNLSLAACIDSSGPILQNAQPLFGQELRLQFYTLRKGFADEPEQASFKWEDTRYTFLHGASA